MCSAVAYRYGDFIYRSYLSLRRDLTGLFLLLAVKRDLNRRLKENRGIHEIFREVVVANAGKNAMTEIATGKEVTFAEFNARCNQYANYFKSNGFSSGDVVALIMENSIEFVAAWMGLAKIGVVTAWINTGLKNEQLAHCLRTSNCKAIISSEAMAAILKETHDGGFIGDHDIKYFASSASSELGGLAVNLAPLLEATPTTEVPSPDSITFRSVLCFIYTSGTTGMPKAAVIKHFRFYSIVMGVAKCFGLHPEDRMYITMPLYHTSAGILGVGQTLLRGTSCVIRQKFSASNFWKDCVKYECTASQYIGEICRYLLAQEEVQEEKQHKVRLMVGNGLRAEIWQEFVDRFHVRIGEFYGSTEGTSNLVNIDGKVGSCGFLPISPLTKKLHPVRLLKVNEETGEVIRRRDGLCIPCEPGETGAMVSTIRKNNPLLVFEGYLNRNETNKKVIHNVFRQGDSVFLTGDILHMDRLGYVYFKDRTGDTFRWKGENVSTTEVESVLMPLKSVVDLVVYGVKVPGVEGSAGMVAAVKQPETTDEEFLELLTLHITRNLAPFAIPVFIRLCDVVDKTGTFKLIKTNLQRQGYRLSDASTDRLFMWDGKARRYQRLEESTVRQIDDGTLGKYL
ncbi:Protein ACS-22 a [Aphelenchoides avenae]|nr:Protein ACS-22 a [Aphelenchus avenae]